MLWPNVLIYLRESTKLSLHYDMQKETGAAGLCASFFMPEPTPLTALGNEADVLGGYKVRPQRPSGGRSPYQHEFKLPGLARLHKGPA